MNPAPPHGPGTPARDSSPGASLFDDAAVAEIAGKTVGRYRLLYPIAAGGMAKVWAAKPATGGLSRTVAIKFVLPQFAVDAEYSRMFVDEAMVASAVHHPNVCEIFELGQEAGLLFMVLEWVAGDSLAGLLQYAGRLWPMPCEVGARIIAEACSGLHAAHDAVGPDGQLLGIVHRDISPPNILLSLHGHVKVSDFGIAKAQHQLHSRTRTGEIKGKLAYVPPEQILGKGVDRRADVYAMGCVLYVATLGLRPFGRGAKALGKIVRGQYPLPRELRPDYPRELEAIIVKALSTDRDRRYVSAEEMRLELEQWLMTVGTPVMHSDIARVVRERLSPKRLQLIEAIKSWSKTNPELLAAQFVPCKERTETPTADARFILQSAAALASLQADMKPVLRQAASGGTPQRLRASPELSSASFPKLARAAASSIPSFPPPSTQRDRRPRAAEVRARDAASNAPPSSGVPSSAASALARNRAALRDASPELGRDAAPTVRPPKR